MSCNICSQQEKKPGSAKPPGHRIPNKYISMNARSPNCAGVRAWLCLFFNHINIACPIRSVKHIFYIYFYEYDLCAWHMTVQTGCSSKSVAAAKYICVWHVTVQTGCSCCSLSAQSIHLREKNIAGPTERSSKGGMPPLLIARREGPAFFDEDDLCAASETSMQPV